MMTPEEEKEIDRDANIGVVFVFATLLAAALSLSLRSPDGRPWLFTAAMTVSLLCLWKAKNKGALLLGLLLFVGLRLAWALSVTK